jgi:hypothetical protein
MRRIFSFRSRLWLGAGALFVAACGENYGLPPAQDANAIDTVQIWALTGTPIGPPAAFDVVIALPVRPELGDAFDLAFDIDSAGNAQLIPATVLGLGGTAGILLADQPFDSIMRAPLDDYVIDSSAVIEVGTVFIARSRNTSVGCSALAGSLPRYAKVEVLEIDETERTVTLQTLANLNCGYRDLDEGVPTS